jgi:hypothetical protein
VQGTGPINPNLNQNVKPTGVSTSAGASLAVVGSVPATAVTMMATGVNAPGITGLLGAHHELRQLTSRRTLANKRSESRSTNTSGDNNFHGGCP